MDIKVGNACSAMLCGDVWYDAVISDDDGIDNAYVSPIASSWHWNGSC